MRTQEWLIVILASVMLIGYSVLYGADEPIKIHVPKLPKQQEDLTVYHRDECIDGRLFRYFFQGKRLVEVKQVLIDNDKGTIPNRRTLPAKCK